MAGRQLFTQNEGPQVRRGGEPGIALAWHEGLADRIAQGAYSTPAHWTLHSPPFHHGRSGMGRNPFLCSPPTRLSWSYTNGMRRHRSYSATLPLLPGRQGAFEGADSCVD
jgi:hypothetical protein